MPPAYAALLTVACVSLSTGCTQHDARQPVTDLRPVAIDVEALDAFTNAKSTIGELVYVPIYSSVYIRSAERQILLTATLSVHNVSLDRSIDLTAVAYFDTKGRRLREFITKSDTLGPLETRHFVIPEADQTGGTGAKFLVRWEAAGASRPPVIEALMLSTTGQQGISFTTQGTVIAQLRTTTASVDKDSIR